MSSELQNIVTEPKQLADMTGEQINQQLLLAKKAGLFFYYVQGMLLMQMKMDWEVKGGEFFKDKYGSETYEEHIEGFYDDRYSADTKIKDFQFMQYSKERGLDWDFVLSLKQSDQITQTRRHLQKKHGSEDVSQYARDINEVNEVLSIADSLGREFRKWRKDEENGENQQPVKADPMTRVQQKAWAYDESLKAMNSHYDNVMGSARKQGIKECIEIMKEKLKLAGEQ